VVLKAGAHDDPAALEADLVRMMREQIGAVASFKRAYVVARLPKTRSGKILRATMRAIADGKEVVIPSTIEDPAALSEIKGTLHPSATR
jgi:propionyl-CoA synthetase